MASIRFLILIVLLAASLFAAPELRLVNTTVGPVVVAAGVNGPTQTLEAFNVSDGTLNLTLTSSSPWLKLSTGTPRPCTSQDGNCIPIQIALQTAALAKGSYTAVVTVSDPKAIDAPQTFTVTVQIGSFLPDQIDLFVTPTGTIDKFVFDTNSSLDWTTTTENGLNWLILSLDAAGSYTFVFPYRIQGRRLDAMGEGIYRGTATIKGSKFPGDNKTVGVTLHITSQPIAVSSSDSIVLRTIQNSSLSPTISLSNRGLGNLAITNVTVNNLTAGFGVTAKQTDASTVTVSTNSASLAPGHYSAQVSVATNGVNGTIVVPLELEIVPLGPPFATFQGVVNNANFATDDPVAQGCITALFGEQLSNSGPQSGTQIPLVTKLGGVRVLVNGQAVPLFFSSTGQINFQLPYETPQGQALVQVERDGQVGNTVSVQVIGIAPRLLFLGYGEYGLVVNQDGTFPVPTALGIGGHPAHIGDTLVIYAIGLGITNPPVATGAAAPSAEPLARFPTTPVSVLFGNRLFNAAQPAVPSFVGLTPGFVGLYQINVTIPPNTASLDVLPVNLAFGTGGLIGSQVRIAVQ
jgi:uncharacterized protein (TIGR03437 family)